MYLSYWCPTRFFDIATSDNTTTTTVKDWCPHVNQNQNNFYKMALKEEMQQYDDEPYASEDKAEEATR